MNAHLLIDAIVRQTTVLIAQLATSGGVRAPLAHVANQVFMDLAREIERQGVNRQVTADMFGISLRSYQRKVQRLQESATDRGRSMWEAVLDHLAQSGVRTKAQLLDRFHRDPEKLVTSILRDLVDSGFVFHSGTGLQGLYRLASDEELEAVRQSTSEHGVAELLWAHIYRHGPITHAELGTLFNLEPSRLDRALASLLADGRVQQSGQDDDRVLSSGRFMVDRSATTGWEASIYDHFQALVATVCARLSGELEQGPYAGYVGGSTYTFDIGPDHPLREEVLSTLEEFRARCSELRSRVASHNADTGFSVSERVIVYGGQTVLADDGNATGGQT